MYEPKENAAWSAAVWVLIIVAVGLGVGLVAAFTIPIPPAPPPPGPHGGPPPSTAVTQLTVVLSTLCLTLLAGLLVVYGRTYRETRAPYILGLVVFLVALFFETAVNSPLLFSAFGFGPGGLGRFLALSDLGLAAALAIFLYLSLQ
jgi:hypothetical protein